MPRIAALRQLPDPPRDSPPRPADRLPAAAGRAAAADLRADGRRTRVTPLLAPRRRSRCSSPCSPPPTPAAIATASPIRRSTSPAIAARRSTRAVPARQPLLDAQIALMWSDEIVAGLARATGRSICRRSTSGCISSRWSASFAAARGVRRALGAILGVDDRGARVLLTFRHRIAKTGANSLEGYMHPRMLAFALGLAALACVVARRASAGPWRRDARAVRLASDHRDLVRHRRAGRGVCRRALADRACDRPRSPSPASSAPGPSLAGRSRAGCVAMDATWLAVLAEKDYLFPTDGRPTRGSRISRTRS